MPPEQRFLDKTRPPLAPRFQNCQWGTPHHPSNALSRRTPMNLPNPVRVSIVALSLMCIPALAQNPAPTATPAPTPTATPAPTPPVTATPSVTVTAEPAATVTATPAATVTAAPAATTPADTSANPEQMKAQMAKMQTTMNEN